MIILLLYLLLPLLLSLLFRLFKKDFSLLSYLVTIALILAYPYILSAIDDYRNPPVPGPRCGMPYVALIMGNLFLGLPVALVLQFIFNYLFVLKKDRNGHPKHGLN